MLARIGVRDFRLTRRKRISGEQKDTRYHTNYCILQRHIALQVHAVVVAQVNETTPENGIYSALLPEYFIRSRESAVRARASERADGGRRERG